MEPDITFFAFAIPAVLFAGISKGGFGSGAAFAATPLLALILSPAQAIGFMLPLLMLMDVGALRPYWRRWNWPSAGVLIAGAVPGILLGAAIYRMTNPDLFRFLIGGVAIAFVLFKLAMAAGVLRRRDAPLGYGAGILAGAIAGLTSFIAHAGGPPVAVYLLSQRLEKTCFQATTVLVFWSINVLKFLPYTLLGFFSRQTLWADAVLMPVALFGVWAGVWLHRRLSERVFFALTYVFLLLTGSKLIFDAVT